MCNFLIYCNEDGISVVAFQDHQLNKVMERVKDRTPFTSAAEADVAPENWDDDRYLMIKGEVVVPKAKQTVTEYTF